jgi:phosphatidylserine/phosphatidylglycerophosphate/cardiolipin synthase-like enzyme
MASLRPLISAFSVCLALAATSTGGAQPAPGAGTASASLEVLFTPQDDAAGAIVAAVQRARTEVLVQAFSFTNKQIARALQRTRARGVRVEVLIDQEQFEKGAAFVARDLVEARVPVWLDAKHAAAHNKVIVVDGQSPDATVISGSFNFTQAAQNKNAENVLIIRSNAALARAYRDNWNNHRTHSTQLQ